ncbi:MAG TPA: hypothetical protein VEL11_11745 [Candidatus Bathyarchaeia archaeon]|nr:hypothetical protein [Candidatus Bathyarchaeia archaeon]
MEAPLNAALAQLNGNNPTPACNQLYAFLNQVNAKQNNGQLTPQQASDLSQQAKAIQQAIGWLGHGVCPCLRAVKELIF